MLIIYCTKSKVYSLRAKINTLTQLGKIWWPFHTHNNRNGSSTATTAQQLKIAPPRFTGEYTAFEEWKCKMAAYLGLRDPSCNKSEQSQGTSDQLRPAPSQAAAEQWVQPSNNLHGTCKATDLRHGDYHTSENIVQRLREQQPLQQLQGRTRKSAQSIGWTKNPAQRTTRICERKRIQQQRKRHRIIQ